MKGRILIYTILCCSWHTTNLGTTIAPNSLEFVINVENANQQTTTKQCSDCLHLFGDKLKECMATLDNENFKRSFFVGMNPYARREYLVHLGSEEHADVLKRFTEEEWKTAYNALTETERTFLPATLTQQWELFDQTRYCMEQQARTIIKASNIGYVVAYFMLGVSGLSALLIPAASYVYIQKTTKPEETYQQLKTALLNRCK
jgi:hypothetical protein